jgi:hypothetical protein
LLKEGVRPEQLADAVRGSNVTLRGGVAELFELLQREGVPLLVFSAGIANVIAEVFKQKLEFPLVESTHIISNWMLFDDTQTHVGFSQPLIHMFNKDEVGVTGATEGEVHAACDGGTLHASDADQLAARKRRCRCSGRERNDLL